MQIKLILSHSHLVNIRDHFCHACSCAQGIELGRWKLAGKFIIIQISNKAKECCFVVPKCLGNVLFILPTFLNQLHFCTLLRVQARFSCHKLYNIFTSKLNQLNILCPWAYTCQRRSPMLVWCMYGSKSLGQEWFAFQLVQKNKQQLNSAQPSLGKQKHNQFRNLCNEGHQHFWCTYAQ